MTFRRGTALVTGIMACTLLACRPAASLAQSAAAPRGWLQYVEAEDAGFSGAVLRAIRESADSARSAAVMVVHRGNVVVAWGDVRRRFQVHSIRKSLAGALYGIAVDRGILPLDATLADLGIDDLDTLSVREKSATVRDLISARSGVYHAAAYADDRQTSSRPPRDSVAPGTHWFYNNWDFNVAESILERSSGADLYGLMDAWIARPIGMEDFHVTDGFAVLEPSNSRFPAHTLRLSTRDLSRFGLLYLRGGRWRGRQVVPTDWVEASLMPQSDIGNGRGYGYLWWTYATGSLPNYPTLNRLDIALARGTGGQALFLFPAIDLLVVHRGDSDNGVSVSGSAIWSMVERIVAARRGPPVASPHLRPMIAEPLRSQLPEPEPHNKVTLARHDLAAVVGEYTLPSSGDRRIRVFEYDQRLFINVPGEGEAELFATSPTAFFLPAVPGVEVVFSRRPDGAISTLRITIGRDRIVAVRA